MLQAELREAETRAAIEEVEIRNVELQMQKKLFEQVCRRMSGCRFACMCVSTELLSVKRG